ncbi:MAG: HAD family phosphatase [Anaerolineaceae bacterium]|nr:HAD family phosphatase [Anaerolineaceae bacterium]
MSKEKLPFPQAILWDLDGTILDTEKAHYLSWKEVLAERSIELSKESFRLAFGGNNRRSLTQWLGITPSQDLIQEIAGRKEALFRKNIQSTTHLFPQVVDWLAYFQGKGIAQALASSAPLENIHTALDTFGLWIYFQQIISGEELPSKPNPAIFLEAASQLGVKAQNCLVFEDSEPGLLGAQRAGMAVICKLGTIIEAPQYVSGAFLNFPKDPAAWLKKLFI